MGAVALARVPTRPPFGVSPRGSLFWSRSVLPLESVGGSITPSGLPDGVARQSHTPTLSLDSASRLAVVQVRSPRLGGGFPCLPPHFYSVRFGYTLATLSGLLAPFLGVWRWFFKVLVGLPPYGVGIGRATPPPSAVASHPTPDPLWSLTPEGGGCNPPRGEGFDPLCHLS